MFFFFLSSILTFKKAITIFIYVSSMQLFQGQVYEKESIMDARVRYTKKVIRQEFLKLLQEKPMDQITVTAICQNAQINRATFYKYYKNPVDLLKQLEQEQLDKLYEKLHQLKATAFQDTLRIVLTTMKEEPLFFQILFSEHGDEGFKHCIYDACYKDNINLIRDIFPSMPESQQIQLFYFIADGCNGILHQWLSDGMKTSIDDIVSFIERLVGAINTMSY